MWRGWRKRRGRRMRDVRFLFAMKSFARRGAFVKYYRPKMQRMERAVQKKALRQNHIRLKCRQTLCGSLGVVLRAPITWAEHALPFGEQSFHITFALCFGCIDGFGGDGLFVEQTLGCRDLRLCVETPLNPGITQNIGD